ncbi:MAG: hypothetical protein FJX22_03135 [Alphaproteobacteria bacterium]|nr:hypothetical protein [Alphaproteobacteria bacterium]
MDYNNLVTVTDSGATDELLRSALEAQRESLENLIANLTVPAATTYSTKLGERYIDGLGC